MAPAILAPILSILAPGLAGLFGNKDPQTQNTNSNTNSSQQQNSFNENSAYSSTTPNLDPATMGFRDQLIKAYTQMLSKDPDLSGYKSQGLREISDSTNRSFGNLQNFLADRGITNTEGAAIGGSNILNNGVNAATTFKNSIPQLALDNLLKQLQSAGGFFSSIPIGQSSNSSNTGSNLVNSTGQQSQQSQTIGSKPNPLGGFITGAAAGASQYWNQLFQNNLARAYGESIARNQGVRSAGSGYGSDPYSGKP